MAESLWGYPPDFMPAVRVLIGALRGDPTIPLQEALHAGWHALGYALSLYDPHPPLVLDGKSDAGDSLADKLEAATAPQGDSEAIPWNIILPLIFEALRYLLRLRSGS